MLYQREGTRGAHFNLRNSSRDSDSTASSKASKFYWIGITRMTNTKRHYYKAKCHYICICPHPNPLSLSLSLSLCSPHSMYLR